MNTLTQNPRYLKHSWKVIKRIKERQLRELDVENGAYPLTGKILPQEKIHGLFYEEKEIQKRADRDMFIVGIVVSFIILLALSF